MNKKEYCFFVISCKKNIRLLDFHLEVLQKSLSEPIEIFASIDEKVEYKKNGVTIICGSKYESFGDRINNAVRKVPYEYIIVMCDDFIVEKEINIAELDAISKGFSIDAKISSVALAKVSGKNNKEYLQLNRIENKYIMRRKFSSFKTTLQCAMWNKNAFMKLMKGAHTPWEFELYQNFKTYSSINTFYAIENDLKQPITYNRGRFIIRGRMVEPERKRLEMVLKTKICTLGYEITDSYIQKDNMSFSQKIHRRFLLYVKNMLFRVLALLKKNDLNLG